ncbi:MAG: tetratricopeptide repeat protein [Thermoanaerobaculaceae bacterium]
MTSKERIKELRREVAANPGSRQFYQLGELLRREGELTEAVEVLRQGLAHHPRYVAAWVSMGRALLDLQELSQARQAFRQALDLDPQNPVAWRLLGEALLGLGLRSEALVAFDQALALVPGDEVLESAVASLKGEALDLSPAPASEVAPEVSPAMVEAPGPTGPFTGEVFPEAQAVSGPPPALVPTPEAALPEPWEGAKPPEPFMGVLSAPPPPPAEVFFFEDVFSPTGAEATVAPQPFWEEGAPPLALPFAETGQVPPSEATAEAVLVMPAPSAEPRTASQEVGEEPESLFAEPAPAKYPTLAEAREAINSGEPGKALVILESLVEAEPENREAVDLLALVRDMLEPLPAEEATLSPRARKIAALQRFLAQVTLARERLGL